MSSGVGLADSKEWAGQRLIAVSAEIEIHVQSTTQGRSLAAI
jgi:hypothetical protein